MKKILFIGCENGLTMHYALYLKNYGYNVTFIVDSPKEDLLNRPEHQVPGISYPYPSWIKEIACKKPHLRAFWPDALFSKYIKIAIQYDVIILAGLYVSIAKSIKNKKIIGIFAGSDLYYLCNTDKYKELSTNGPLNKITLLSPLKKFIAKKILANNFNGLTNLNSIYFFPPSLCKDGDEIISKAIKINPKIKRESRYDIPLDINGILPNTSEIKKEDNILKIICPVRFCFDKLPGGDKNLNKGNDKIIKALSEFKKTNPEIKISITFYNKGPDTDTAKKILENSNLKNCVTWNEQSTLKDLLLNYQKHDICIDQCGDHWMGAIGLYAIILKIPLITNGKIESLRDYFPTNNYFINTESVEQISSALTFLSNRKSLDSFSKNIPDLNRNLFDMSCVAQKIIKDIES